MNEKEYAGFWVRAGASIIDSVLILIVIVPILNLIYDDYWNNQGLLLGAWDLILNYIVPAIVVVTFWIYRSATPGKMALKLSIVDAKTGEKPSKKQLIIRYLGYYVSIIPLCLGMLWVGIDKRKQGWHDKLAGTVVIKNNLPEPVVFESEEKEQQ